jgi:hypothetical protein
VVDVLKPVDQGAIEIKEDKFWILLWHRNEFMVHHIDLSWNQIEMCTLLMYKKLIELGFYVYKRGSRYYL